MSKLLGFQPGNKIGLAGAPAKPSGRQVDFWPSHSYILDYGQPQRRGREEQSVGPHRPGAERLLRRLDLTLRSPDAIHLAVAMRIGSTLATFDRKLAEIARVLKVRTAQI
jgi:hypothetical protein